MPPIKRLLCPERLRSLPPQFSWVDHRLARDHHFERCDVCAWAVYLFLVTVADAQGLSYYSDASMSRRLSLDPARLARARADLVRAGLIAYAHPLYQVLALPAAVVAAPSSDPRARLDALRQALGKST